MSAWPEAGPGTVVLLVAMVWFNLLAVRVVEPSLAERTHGTSNSCAFFRKARPLPVDQAGQAVLGPGLMAAAGLTFFAFVLRPRALVGPGHLTLEVLLAEQGSGAGIPGYRVDLSRLVSVLPWLKRRFF